MVRHLNQQVVQNHNPLLQLLLQLLRNDSNVARHIQPCISAERWPEGLSAFDRRLAYIAGPVAHGCLVLRLYQIAVDADIFSLHHAIIGPFRAFVVKQLLSKQIVLSLYCFELVLMVHQILVCLEDLHL